MSRPELENCPRITVTDPDRHIVYVTMTPQARKRRRKGPYEYGSRIYDSSIDLPAYIYKITLSKPLRGVRESFRDRISDRYSGIFSSKRHRTSENSRYTGYRVKFKKSDMTKIQLIYDPLSRETEPLPPRDRKVSENVASDVVKFLTGRGGTFYPDTRQAVYDLGIRPDHSVTVFRGMESNDPTSINKSNNVVGQVTTYHSTRVSSWSTNYCVADLFASQGYKFGIVLKMVVSPENIFLDTRMLIPPKMLGEEFVLSEVVVMPGVYTAQVVMLRAGDVRLKN